MPSCQRMETVNETQTLLDRNARVRAAFTSIGNYSCKPPTTASYLLLGITNSVRLIRRRWEPSEPSVLYLVNSATNHKRHVQHFRCVLARHTSPSLRGCSLRIESSLRTENPVFLPRYTTHMLWLIIWRDPPHNPDTKYTYYSVHLYLRFSVIVIDHEPPTPTCKC